MLSQHSALGHCVHSCIVLVNFTLSQHSAAVAFIRLAPRPCVYSPARWLAPDPARWGSLCSWERPGFALAGIEPKAYTDADAVAMEMLLFARVPLCSKLVFSESRKVAITSIVLKARSIDLLCYRLRSSVLQAALSSARGPGTAPLSSARGPILPSRSCSLKTLCYPSIHAVNTSG